MRILIAEDDLNSRKFLAKFLSQYGECDVVVDGFETLDAVVLSLKDRNPYSLLCLDIMMPKVNGVKVLKAIRELETKHGILPQRRCKVILTTALGETELVKQAFEHGCEAYIRKPLDLSKLLDIIQNLRLIDVRK